MKQRQVELNRVEEELKKRNQEILDLQLRLHEAEKTLVRQLPYMVCLCVNVSNICCHRNVLYSMAIKSWSQLRRLKMVQE